MLSGIKQRDSVEAGHQGPVERTNRRHEGGVLAGLQHGGDQGVDGGVLGAHVVAGALDVGGLASPVERLLVARRQRLIPAVLDHVEIESKPALIELHGIDHAHRRLDTRALQVALIGQRDPLLIARRHQNFEGERRLGRALPQYRAVEIVTGLRQQAQRATQRYAIAARTVADGKAVAAVKDVGSICDANGFSNSRSRSSAGRP